MADMSKQLDTKQVNGASASQSGGNKSGVTGSERNYGKKSPDAAAPDMSLTKKFNPMNWPASTYGINGV